MDKVAIIIIIATVAIALQIIVIWQTERNLSLAREIRRTRVKSIKQRAEVKNAAIVLEEIRGQVNKGVIKDFEIAPMVNIHTHKTTGIAVILQLGRNFDFPSDVLEDWKERLRAYEYLIDARHNQLHVTFKIKVKEDGQEGKQTDNNINNV